jgi:hypothetical protein
MVVSVQIKVLWVIVVWYQHFGGTCFLQVQCSVSYITVGLRADITILFPSKILFSCISCSPFRLAWTRLTVLCLSCNTTAWLICKSCFYAFTVPFFLKRALWRQYVALM